jgi:hypothetical protein
LGLGTYINDRAASDVRASHRTEARHLGRALASRCDDLSERVKKANLKNLLLERSA